MSELAKREEPALSQPSTGAMLQAFIAAGVTAENVGAFERLVALQERQEEKEAQRSFNRAFTALQRHIPTITADKQVNDQHGKLMYRYCSYEEILKQVQPFLTQYGFAVSFSQSIGEGVVTATCHLMHEDGHTGSNSYSARAGNKGAPGMNETKIDLSASTSAQREAFCDALNIIRRGKDVETDDARKLGATISASEAADLHERVVASGSKEKDFLAIAGVSSFEEIHEASMGVLDRLLRKKEGR